MFRDELNAQEDCNPDILIEQDGKENNPHKTKYVDNNDKYLGCNSDIKVMARNGMINIALI